MATTPLEHSRAESPSPLARTGAVAVRLVGVVLLAMSAGTHLHLAPLYNIGPPITTGQLFVAQGVLTALIALWLLVRNSVAAWLVATVLMAASLAAVLASVRLSIPAFGPFPSLYEPIWFPEKVLSALAEGSFVALSLARAAVLRRRRLT